MLSRTAPIKAATKSRTWNPVTSAAASSSMSALITNQNRPSVSSVSGKVRILRIKPIVALIKPMAAAAISAATGPLTVMPGTTWATIHTARALRTQCSRSRTIGLLHPMIGHYTRETGSKDKRRAAPRSDGDPLRTARVRGGSRRPRRGNRCRQDWFAAGTGFQDAGRARRTERYYYGRDPRKSGTEPEGTRG